MSATSEINFSLNKIDIEGIVSRVLFRNGVFAIFVITNPTLPPKGITIKGNIQSIAKGMRVRVIGEKVIHPKFGQQIAATTIEPIIPSITDINKKNYDEIIAYLGSGIIDGVGEATAKKIVDKFGDSTFDILDNSPDKLLSITGISNRKIKMISESWRVNRATHDIYMFLKSHGLTLGKAADVVDHFGYKSSDWLKRIITNNPYVLCEVDGIGFKTADSFAQACGISGSDPRRIRHGIEYAFMEGIIGATGSTGTTCEELLRVAAKILELPKEIVNPVLLEMLETDNRLTVVGNNIFLTAYYKMERSIAKDIKRLLDANGMAVKDIEENIRRAEAEIGIELSDTQRAEVITILQSNVAVLTGFPGTGKTTILDVVLKVLSYEGNRQNFRNLTLCAPSGKAADRMKEVTGIPAETIHSTLGVSENKFIACRDNQLESDFFVVDESSMVDVPLAAAMLEAIPTGCKVLFIGDVDQLPSIGAGRFFADIIDSNCVPVCRLTEIRRQGPGSYISLGAKEINCGRVPKLFDDTFKLTFADETAVEMQQGGVAINRIIETQAEVAMRCIIDLFKERMKTASIYDIQVLTPMKGTECGTHRLNTEIQALVNAQNIADPNAHILHMGRKFAIGDRVLWTKNDKRTGLRNGSYGKIISVDSKDRVIMVDFGTRTIEIPYSSMGYMELYWAGTIHKSQGSEFKHVIMPVIKSHYIMLNKNVIYTGITRGKSTVDIVTDSALMALRIAVKTEDTNLRITSLKNHIEEICKPSRQLSIQYVGEIGDLFDDVPM